MTLSKKKLIFVINTFPIDNTISQGKFNYRAAVQLNEKTSIKIIHLRSWKPWRKIIERKQIGELEVTVFSFPYYPYLLNHSWTNGLQMMLYKRFFIFSLGKELKEGEYVHSVGAGFSGVVGSWISEQFNIPHIAQCIGTDVNYTLPSLQSTIGIKGMEKYVDYFTCNSKALEKQVLKIFPEAKTLTIYRGVDLDYFKLFKDNLNKEGITFTFLGGLSLRKETGKGRDYKGGETLLKAWRNIKEYKTIKLNFVGPEVTQSLVNEILEGEAHKFNISVQQSIDKQSVKEMLAISDVVIIPSWAEGLPNVGMEALASSCAIIGSNVGGIPELIDGNGYLFEPGDFEKLTFLIRKITSNRSSLVQMKIKSRQIAESKFDDKQFPDQYLKLYETL